MSQPELREAQLLREIEALRSELELIKQANRDLQIELDTATEHGDCIEKLLQEEIVERSRAESKLRALLQILSKDKDDLEIMLQLMAEHGDAVETQLYETAIEASSFAMTDSLTQLANRRHLDDYLAKVWLQMARERGPLSLILCDVDHFKLYNDYYGHQQGDRCLKSVSNAIVRAVKRPADMVARYGGEEFAIVLPNTNAQGALLVAKQIQVEIENLQLPHPNSLSCDRVTVSLGVSSTVPLDNLSPESLIAVTDRALYEAKKQGRNRLIFRSCNALTAFKNNA